MGCIVVVMVDTKRAGRIVGKLQPTSFKVSERVFSGGIMKGIYSVVSQPT